MYVCVGGGVRIEGKEIKERPPSRKITQIVYGSRAEKKKIPFLTLSLGYFGSARVNIFKIWCNFSPSKPVLRRRTFSLHLIQGQTEVVL